MVAIVVVVVVVDDDDDEADIEEAVWATVVVFVFSVVELDVELATDNVIVLVVGMLAVVDEADEFEEELLDEMIVMLVMTSLVLNESVE